MDSDRIDIWLCLSNLYLDTELQAFELKSMADLFKDLDMSLEELQKVDRYEVFPSLYKNHLSVAGAWAAFDKAWLVQQCEENKQKRKSWFFRAWVQFLDYFLYSMRKNDWEKIAYYYRQEEV